MALKRIIPCLLYDGKGLVKTIKFKNPSYVGDPINAIKIFNDKEVDELILLDINASKQKRKPNFEEIANMAGEAFMPFAYGGGVKSYEDFVRLFQSGVEKVVVNSLVQENAAEIKKVVADFGSQAVVASIDFKKGLFGKVLVHSYSGHKIAYNLKDYVKHVVEELGVGEIMLTSVDNEGTWLGYDYDIVEEIVALSLVPVIASGGCGTKDDIKKVLFNSSAAAAAVGSMAVYSKKGMGVLINFPERSQLINVE